MYINYIQIYQDYKIRKAASAIIVLYRVRESRNIFILIDS